MNETIRALSERFHMTDEDVAAVTTLLDAGRKRGVDGTKLSPDEFETEVRMDAESIAAGVMGGDECEFAIVRAYKEALAEGQRQRKAAA